MSTGEAEAGLAARTTAALEDSFRWLALGCVLALTAAYVSVLRDIAVVVGGSSDVVPVTIVVLVVASVLAGTLREPTAILLTVGLAALGYGWYLLVTPGGLSVVVTAWDRLLSDALALLTGLSVIQLHDAEVWAIGFAPAPVFLSWYLALRRRYVGATAVGGAALAVFVLTGDAETMVTLSGVLAAVGAIGFGELDRLEGALEQVDALLVVVAFMALVALTVTVIPAGTGATLSLHGVGGVGAGSADTVEGSLMNSPDQLRIQGPIDLSPEVRFVVESDEPHHWRTGTYDRFAGDSWFRSGDTEAYDGRLAGPPGEGETITQTYEFETRMSAMPAASEPVDVRGDVADYTRVTDHGSFQSDRRFLEGDSYTVVSERPRTGRSSLAGTNYPDEITEYYLQLPADQPDRVGEATAEITANAHTPYDTAVTIEQYLQTEKNYSLDVDRPDGNIADAFLFEMDAGYCTYFATTMVAMLREEGIPARLAVGYSTGEPIDDDRYVVRGLNSHAWVEVYFPNQGWVTFDPTPAAPREDVRIEEIEDARERGLESVDIEETEPEDEADEGEEDRDEADEDDEQTIDGPGERRDRETRPTPTPDDSDDTSDAPSFSDISDRYGDADEDAPVVPVPDRETIGVGLVAIMGIAAGVRRTGYPERFSRSVRMRWHGRRGDPERDVERAFDRLELVLEGRFRDRRPTETPREFVDAAAEQFDDERIGRVRQLYERARYDASVSRSEADEAIALVDDVVADESQFPWPRS